MSVLFIWQNHCAEVVPVRSNRTRSSVGAASICRDLANLSRVSQELCSIILHCFRPISCMTYTQLLQPLPLSAETPRGTLCDTRFHVIVLVNFLRLHICAVSRYRYHPSVKERNLPHDTYYPRSELLRRLDCPLPLFRCCNPAPKYFRLEEPPAGERFRSNQRSYGLEEVPLSDRLVPFTVADVTIFR